MTDTLGTLIYAIAGEIVHRAIPPHNCSMGCPEYLSDICAECYRRPVKSIERFGGK